MSLRTMFSGRRPAASAAPLALVPAPQPAAVDTEAADRREQLQRRLEELDAQLTLSAVRAAGREGAEREAAVRLELARAISARLDLVAHLRELHAERARVQIALGYEGSSSLVSTNGHAWYAASPEPVREIMDRMLVPLADGPLRRLLAWLRPSQSYPGARP